ESSLSSLDHQVLTIRQRFVNVSDCVSDVGSQPRLLSGQFHHTERSFCIACSYTAFGRTDLVREMIGFAFLSLMPLFQHCALIVDADSILRVSFLDLI